MSKCNERFHLYCMDKLQDKLGKFILSLLASKEWGHHCNMLLWTFFAFALNRTLCCISSCFVLFRCNSIGHKRERKLCDIHLQIKNSHSAIAFSFHRTNISIVHGSIKGPLKTRSLYKKNFIYDCLFLTGRLMNVETWAKC